MKTIDMRSDTVSHPTPAMWEAMSNAAVGDDVYGDDPTVNKLEAETATMFGMEDALFVSSGTQGNLIALLTHCERGSEIICGNKSHIFLNETGGMSALGGIMPHILPVQSDGTLDLDHIKAAIRGNDPHYPRTRLVAIENTQNAAGGKAIGAAYTQSVAALAKENGLIFHIDGARIFNAAAACSEPVKNLVTGADSVSVCLSKGLCAPVGSMLVGGKAFIAEARRTRKMVGGGMRQAGILAAAGLIALHEMSTRLHEDHAHAMLLAEGLSEIPGLTVNSQSTSFVYLQLNADAPLSPAEFKAALRERDIIISSYPGVEDKFRLVTHYWITEERVHQVIDTMRELLTT
ncbi:MAG: low-specificity L-threonine aldolase [Aggregatilineales bacterium]